MKKLFVEYRRVSRESQGEGHGMDAQKDAITAYLASVGGELIGSFQEIESGKLTSSDRPELHKAIVLAKKRKATLLIAKLDRLARNAAFLLNLRDAGCDFLAVDMPHADKFTVGIMALLAEKERDMISQRTKDGLAAAKRRGVKLGNPKHAEARKSALAVIVARADAYSANLLPVVRQIQGTGIVSLQGIAGVLNIRGFTSPRGSTFTPQTVKNLLARGQAAPGHAT